MIADKIFLFLQIINSMLFNRQNKKEALIAPLYYISKIFIYKGDVKLTDEKRSSTNLFRTFAPVCFQKAIFA